MLSLKLLPLLLLACTALSLTTACYRMPTEEDYSVIPMTNSADFTKEGENPLTPNMNY